MEIFLEVVVGTSWFDALRKFILVFISFLFGSLGDVFDVAVISGNTMTTAAFEH